jgi:hypothetical protein
LIHEFWHIFTLWENQMIKVYGEMPRINSTCKTNFVIEWCLKKWSYLDWFINKFWSSENFKDWEVVKEVKYSSDKFVTEYATTNPWEDIAESFTHFVLDKKAVWSTIRDAKVNYFYDFPEAVKLRDIIREKLLK